MKRNETKWNDMKQLLVHTHTVMLRRLAKRKKTRDERWREKKMFAPCFNDAEEMSERKKTKNKLKDMEEAKVFGTWLSAEGKVKLKGKAASNIFMRVGEEVNERREWKTMKIEDKRKTRVNNRQAERKKDETGEKIKRIRKRKERRRRGIK